MKLRGNSIKIVVFKISTKAIYKHIRKVVA